MFKPFGDADIAITSAPALLSTSGATKEAAPLAQSITTFSPLKLPSRLFKRF